MKLKLIILIACIPTVGMTQSVKPVNTVQTAVPFIDITPDSRSGAMGDVGVALSPDANAIFWNTSRLAFSEENIEIAASYSPWLRQVVKGVNLSYLSGYKVLEQRHVVGGAFRFFSYGKIQLTDSDGVPVTEYSPKELELVGSYAFKLSDKHALGANAKFIHSNIIGNYGAGALQTKNAMAIAVDLSYLRKSEDFKIGEKWASFSWGAVIANLGNRMTYISSGQRSFLPIKLKLGTAITYHFNDLNDLTASLDMKKYLVPTTPIYNSSNEIISGKDTDVGVMTGVLRSFYDAPGYQIVDSQGVTSIKKGSRIAEELNEINFGFGLEYWYDKRLSARTGYYYEHFTKGNRKHFTFGLGLMFKNFGVNASYLVSVSKFNPLGNTVRFGVNLKLRQNVKPLSGIE